MHSIRTSLSRHVFSLVCGTLLSACVLFFLSWTTPSHAQAASAAFDEKVVYHVDDPAAARMALNNIANHLDVSPQAKIALVANGRAIPMLTQGEYSSAIADLQKRGVRFIACHNSMKGFGIEESKLVPGAIVVPAGVAELSRLQGAEHYSYIKP